MDVVNWLAWMVHRQKDLMSSYMVEIGLMNGQIEGGVTWWASDIEVSGNCKDEDDIKAGFGERF